MAQIERWTKGAPGFVGKANRQLAQIEQRIVRGPAGPTQVMPRPRQSYQPILAKITGIHDNYVEAQRWKQAPDESDPPRYPWSLDTEVTLNVALPPDLQLQFYESAELNDPLDGGTSLTFEAGSSSQERTVTRDDGDETEEDQRIVPWLSTDTTNAPPVLILPMKLWVPNDADNADVACSHILAGPHMWARE